MDGAELRMRGAQLRLVRIIVLVVVILGAIHVIMSVHRLSSNHSLQHQTKNRAGTTPPLQIRRQQTSTRKPAGKNRSADDRVAGIDKTGRDTIQSVIRFWEQVIEYHTFI